MHLTMETAMETNAIHERDLQGEPVSAAAVSPPTQVGEARARCPELKVVSRQVSPKHDQHLLVPKNAQAPGRRSAAQWVLGLGSRLATLVIALVAVLISVVAWDHYVMAPWTRDGRLRVQVASVAP